MWGEREGKGREGPVYGRTRRERRRKEGGEGEEEEEGGSRGLGQGWSSTTTLYGH